MRLNVCFASRLPCMCLLQLQRKIDMKVHVVMPFSLAGQCMHCQACLAHCNNLMMAHCNKLMMMQVKSLREKLSVLLDKSSTDDRLIATLQNELQKLQYAGKSAKHDADLDTMLQQMESLKRKYAQQVEQVARQEQVIAAMQAVSPRQTDSR